MNQLFAEMESHGPQFSSAIKAICTLGRRSERKGLRNFPDVQAHIAIYMRDELAKTNKSNAPGSAIARIWEINEPFLPERVLSDDSKARSKLPTWARDELDWRAIHARMGLKGNDRPMNPALTPQVQHTTVGSSASSQVESSGSWRGLLILAGLAISAYLTRNHAVKGPAEPERRPPSPRMSLTGRREKYGPRSNR